LSDNVPINSDSAVTPAVTRYPSIGFILHYTLQLITIMYTYTPSMVGVQRCRWRVNL